jgi:multiple sugar transport system substrate-binding protein
MKNKGIKMFTVFALVFVLLFNLTACGSSEQAGADGKAEPQNESNSSEQKVLRFWYFHNAEHAEGKYLASIAKRYTEEVDKNVKIEIESVPWDDYIGSKLTTAFATGEGPDIFLVAPPTMLKYVDTGVLQPLNKYLTREMQADFLPNALEGVTIDGNIYAVPFETDLLGLFYDIDAFKEAGLQPPTTWDELMGAAQKLKTDKRAGITFELGNNPFQVFQFLPFLWMTGADVFTADRKHSGLDHKGVGEALQLWKDLYATGAANQKPSRGTGEIGILAEGETAMQVIGSWSIGSIENDYPDKNIGVVPFPIPSGGKNTTVAGGWKMVASSKGKYADDAAKFAVWAWADKVDIPTKWATEAKFAFPVRKSVLEEGKAVFNKGLRKDFTENILGTEIPELRAPAEITKILQDMIQDALFNKDTSGEQAAQKAHEKLEKFLKTYKGKL